MTPTPRGASASPLSIALLNPLGDYGMGSYAHELAEGLVEAGARPDLYAAGRLATAAFPRRHRLYPVLGSTLVRQRDVLREATLGRRAGTPTHDAPAAGAAASDGAKAARAAARPGTRRHPWLERARDALVPRVLPVELAAYLRWRRYDVAWTQWPIFVRGAGGLLWDCLDALGLTLVHTAHDVRPHEPIRGYFDICATIYRRSALIVVHSRSAARELLELYPDTRGRALVAPHGLYTLYPRRDERRHEVRRRLGVTDGESVVLFFGGIRPYKNLDGVLDALAADRDGRMVLVVAGSEQGYADLVPGDPLGRTRRLVAERGLERRVRLLPGPFDPEATAELFAATDVAVLPYLRSSGSGLQLLCMTFGVHIAATAVGGMDEYLAEYPRGTLLAGPEPAQVLDGLREAVAAASRWRHGPVARLAHLEWPAIARYTLAALERGPPDPFGFESFAERLAAGPRDYAASVRAAVVSRRTR